MRQAHHPLWYEKLAERWNRRFAEHFVEPHFESLGVEPRFAGCQYIDIRGPNIRGGDHLHIYATRHEPVSLAVDPFSVGGGGITFGSYCILAPGVRIRSACSISIGDNCMFGEDTLVTDADWHDHYHRIYPGKQEAIVLENNVWVGTRVTICKGVTIGENSIIGAGSIVTRDIPKNSIAAGNPARVVSELDPLLPSTRRDALFIYDTPYQKLKDDFDLQRLAGNTLGGWVRSILFPTRKH
jgi:acetyltransferase-like isoleucine patch superfamily enzyme